ncbi:DUF4412 domain-containing protein [Syntrophobacter fumaroxidans]|uniref:DUF4412 domain-containing protein n=1 Tax=Syntrophobacter fumaroxidans (strain DSM 10017 / MPOB) TaxID=335543 RepID=A0LQP1_SYNFM|nr:DUF4412 domain-containing protein [Syntrophobacter fumaroxidans]ABK19743.1 conserved hypothetical protein [Syntrophobacter fumaroxidans MPOB]
MKNSKLLIPLCLAIAMAFSTALFLPGSCGAVEFSADLVIQPKGEEAMKGKIYVKGDKVRQEILEEGDNQIMIIRPDKKVTWMISPDEKTYMEMPYQAEDKTFEEWTENKEKNSKLIGEETISGIQTNKYENIEDGEKTYFWISKKFPFPIKVEDAEITMEYKNIKEGQVDAALFELPAGYEKMSMPTLPGKSEE